MSIEKTFFKELAHVPALPEGTFDAIARNIARRRHIGRMVYALAAMLVIALGTTLVFLPPTDSAVAAARELQTVHDYLNGTDLAEELQVYAVYYDE